MCLLDKCDACWGVLRCNRACGSLKSAWRAYRQISTGFEQQAEACEMAFVESRGGCSECAALIVFPWVIYFGTMGKNTMSGYPF